MSAVVKPKGLNPSLFLKNFQSSAEGGPFNVNDIIPFVGLRDPGEVTTEDVDTLVAFDLAFDTLKRQYIDIIPENAEPRQKVVILTNGAAHHPPESTSAYFADVGMVGRRLADFERQIHSANFSEQPGTKFAMHWAMINAAFQRGVPLVFAKSNLTEGDKIAISRMRDSNLNGKRYSYVVADEFPPADAPGATQG